MAMRSRFLALRGRGRPALTQVDHKVIDRHGIRVDDHGRPVTSIRMLIIAANYYQVVITYYALLRVYGDVG